jgi:hypothetical protein
MAAGGQRSPKGAKAVIIPENEQVEQEITNKFKKSV